MFELKAEIKLERHHFNTIKWLLKRLKENRRSCGMLTNMSKIGY